MSSELASGGRDDVGDAASDDESGKDDGTLVSIYRAYIGEPGSRQDVYIGFGLFFAGIALGLVGLVLFVYSGFQPAESSIFWQLREAALIAVMLALPTVTISISVLLPVGRRTMAAGFTGTVICLVATAWLTQVYPFQWTDTGNDIRVIGAYSVGVVVLAASTGSALVAQYVDRVAPRGDSPEERTAASATEEPDVSDDQVEQDIEEAMEDSTLTWGGVDQKPTTERLELNMPDTDTDIEAQEVEETQATEMRSAGGDVEEAVDGLRTLQGGDTETARAESPDDQVSALSKLQETQEQEIETGVDTDRGFFDRLREIFP